MTNLFVNGAFTTHNGETLPWKIDCDALVTADWDTIAAQIASKIPFQGVYGVPTGGEALAAALQPYAQPTFSNFPFLIIDDVLTTGGSMQAAKEQFSSQYRNIIGFVLFSRMQDAPNWIQSIFTLNSEFNQ